MNPSVRTVVFALVLLPCAIGCAEQEVQAGQAAFPEAVGYTPPSSVPVPPGPPPGVQAPPGVPQGGPDSQQAPEEIDVDGQDGGQYADTDPSALTDFRSTLDPYGSWTEDPTYGTAWVPSESVVGSDFTPYVSAGHWAYDNDYVWVSDYDWGWAPFHYGRWVYGGAAWEWIPGRAYAGAWTSWRYGYGDWGYVGWAPLPPTWGWRGGRAVGLGFVPAAPYTFVGNQHLFAPVVGMQVVTGGRVGLIASHTQPFVPASPGVGGLGGHSVAHPTVGGPPPSALNLQSSAVVRASATDRGLSQARAYSRVSTATALGARGPASVPARNAPAGASGARVPSYAANPSHFGGRLGAGFSGSVASAAPSRGYAGSSRPYYGSSPSYGSQFSGRSSAGYGGYGGYAGSHGGYSGGGYHGGGGSSQGFHGGGGGGSFHGGGGGGFGGGGGGFHGGGGGGHGGGHR